MTTLAHAAIVAVLVVIGGILIISNQAAAGFIGVLLWIAAIGLVIWRRVSTGQMK